MLRTRCVCGATSCVELTIVSALVEATKKHVRAEFYEASVSYLQWFAPFDAKLGLFPSMIILPIRPTAQNMGVLRPPIEHVAWAKRATNDDSGGNRVTDPTPCSPDYAPIEYLSHRLAPAKWVRS